MIRRTQWAPSRTLPRVAQGWRRVALVGALAWVVVACGDASDDLEIGAGAPPSGAVGVPYNVGNGVTCSRSGQTCTPCFVGGTTRACPTLWRYQNSFVFAASGGSAPFSWTATGLPPGITIATDGVIRGTPTAAGSYTASLHVADSAIPANDATGSATIDIDSAPPPTIATSPAVPTAAINRAYAATFAVGNGELPLTWSETGALPPGMAFSSTGVLSGTPIVAGEYPITVMVEDASAQSATPLDITIEVVQHGFRSTGSMIAARTAHTATLLETGNVLIAGGYDGSQALATAELFNPNTGTFTAAGTFTDARQRHTATLLKDGRVLITGGVPDAASDPLVTTQIFIPASGRFVSTGRTVAARHTHTATLLEDGSVLLVGGTGVDGVALASAEIYNPSSGTFSSVGTMANARSGHTATLLENGDVLVVGGVDATGAAVASAEIFDAFSHRFTVTGSMKTARSNHAAMLLQNGDVLIAGGLNAAALATAEVYNVANGTFSAVTMRTEHSAPSATLLGNGTVLLTGGGDAGWHLVSSAELYDAQTDAFTATGSMTTARDGHTATLLANGSVLVTGGSNGAVLSSAEIYQ